MREALRLAPTAPLRSTSPYEETVIGNGKYVLEKDARVLCGIYMIQRDPRVWGEDVCIITLTLAFPIPDLLSQAEEFRPERMLDGKFEALPVCCT